MFPYLAMPPKTPMSAVFFLAEEEEEEQVVNIGRQSELKTNAKAATTETEIAC